MSAAKTERFQLRMSEDDRRLIGEGAAAADLDRSAFVLPASRTAAHRVPADRRTFVLSTEQQEAWETLDDEPPQDLPSLRAWLLDHARQSDRSGLTKAFVVTTTDADDVVASTPGAWPASPSPPPPEPDFARARPTPTTSSCSRRSPVRPSGELAVCVVAQTLDRLIDLDESHPHRVVVKPSSTHPGQVPCDGVDPLADVVEPGLVLACHSGTASSRTVRRRCDLTDGAGSVRAAAPFGYSRVIAGDGNLGGTTDYVFPDGVTPFSDSDVFEAVGIDDAEELIGLEAYDRFGTPMSDHPGWHHLTGYPLNGLLPWSSGVRKIAWLPGLCITQAARATLEPLS